MGAFAAGQVALLAFPFSDLSRGKFRPALLLAEAGRGDWIACQITSNPHADSRTIVRDHPGFASGGLQRISCARPGKLFTAHVSVMEPAVGALHAATLGRVCEAMVAMIRGQ